MFIGSIQGLLDRENTIVFGGRLNKRNNRVIRIKWMVQHYVVSTQFLEKVGGL